MKRLSDAVYVLQRLAEDDPAWCSDVINLVAVEMEQSGFDMAESMRNLITDVCGDGDTLLCAPKERMADFLMISVLTMFLLNEACYKASKSIPSEQFDWMSFILNIKFEGV